MTIERYSYKPALHIDDITTTKLNEVLFFAKPQEIPPGHKQNITPDRCPYTCILHTYSRETNGQEDTIGKLEVTQEEIKRTIPIDEHTPIAIVAEKGLLPPSGYNLNEVIIYTPSDGAQKIMFEQAAQAVPLESVIHTEQVEAIPISLS
jgi:hypothetical protein